MNRTRPLLWQWSVFQPALAFGLLEPQIAQNPRSAQSEDAITPILSSPSNVTSVPQSTAKNGPLHQRRHISQWQASIQTRLK